MQSHLRCLLCVSQQPKAIIAQRVSHQNIKATVNDAYFYSRRHFRIVLKLFEIVEFIIRLGLRKYSPKLFDYLKRANSRVAIYTDDVSPIFL